MHFYRRITATEPLEALHPQVVTVKSRYIIDNQTGGAIEVKQLATPDLDDPAGGPPELRCAQRLAINERCA